LEDLCVYEIPTHRNVIAYFKIFNHDLYESENKYLANVIATITIRNEVFLWYENLVNVNLSPI
jgi:hypothetical protein